MTRITLISTITTVMVTTASADSSFGDIFKDINDVSALISKDLKDSAFLLNDGVVEITKSSGRVVRNVGSDIKEISVKVYDDIKTAEVVTINVSNTVKEAK